MSLTVETTTPGVTAIVNAGQVARPIDRQPSSTAFVIGFAPWGEIGVAKIITSWAECLRVFGGFHALGYLADFAYIFFNLFLGKQIVAVRAGAADATKATLTRKNRVGGGTDTFKFEAKHPSLTVDISVTISDVTDNTNLCDIKITSAALNITENYKDADIRDASVISTINAASKLVNISLVAATVAGATGRPVAGTFALAGGDDGSAAFDIEDLGSFLAQFESENLGTGQVCIPGYSASNIAALTAHAENYNRLALLEPDLATEYADVADDFNTAPSSFAAAYFPWIEMRAVDGSGVKKFYPPSIFAAGACAKVDRTIGTHKAPANIIVPGALDVERNSDGTSVINDNVREFLNGKNINVIAPIAGEGIKIYGARVLYPSGETRVRFVHERRMLNLIYYSAKLGYSWAVFAVVDGQGRLFRDLVSSGKNFLRNFWRDGALFGRTEEEAFVVIADATNNPPEELENGRVHVQLGVKLSPTAEVIIINIDSVPLSQDLGALQN